MAKPKRFRSPRLELTITDDQVHDACQSNSNGCLIADAIKDKYPHLSGVTVDMATIRVSDRAAGVRYTYLTPAPAQHVLLAFDQGWPVRSGPVLIKNAVKIDPIVKFNNRGAGNRAERIAYLEAKERDGTITPREKSGLTRLRNSKAKGPYPGKSSPRGKTEVETDPSDGSATVRGGTPIPQGKAHPNLLRLRNRHFGAKLSDPGEAFREAVETAIKEREALKLL